MGRQVACQAIYEGKWISEILGWPNNCSFGNDCVGYITHVHVNRSVQLYVPVFRISLNSCRLGSVLIEHSLLRNKSDAMVTYMPTEQVE